MSLPPEDVSDMLRNSPVKCILAGTGYLQQAIDIQSYAASNSLPAIQVAPIKVHHACPEALWDLPIQIDERFIIPETHSGIVMASSGTSGTTKGVIRSRGFFYNHPRAAADESMLVHRPATWIAGIKPLTFSILMGCRAEIIDPAAGMDLLWERLRARRVTSICSGPLLWTQLAQYYREHLSHLPEKDEYIQGARHIRDASTGSCVVLQSLLKFWRDEIGIRLALCYGSTEAGVPITAVYPEEEEYNEQVWHSSCR
jgi:malonyl-CoA/methylmalonyl-CoA synthetase